MKPVLEGIKVIEYGEYIQAPFCSKLLADLGADVIKIEKPGSGDISRRREPFLNDTPGLERSGLFLYLNANKRGVTLDIEKATGQQIFKSLLKNSHLLIEDTQPGKLAALGLGYNDLKLLNPSLVKTSVTQFGQTGPYKNRKGCDLTIWHMSGAGFVTPRNAGTTEQEPLKVVHMADFITGMIAALATLGALRVQKRSGIGQEVDVSSLEAVTQLAGWANVYWPFAHESTTRASRAWSAPVHFLKCKDGWVFLLCAEEHHWRAFVEMMGNPTWAGEELFKTRISRGDYWESLKPLIEPWIIQHTKEELFEQSKAKRVPLAPVYSMKELLENKHLMERQFFINVEHPETGTLTYPGAPFKFSTIPWAIRRPAPLLGQHNEDVYCNELGYAKPELVKMYEIGII